MFDYQEITKKDGKKIIFCNMQELLEESFGVKGEEAVKTFLKGDEYICHCPFCKAEGHTKHKLYVKSDLSVGHCFVCTRAFVNVDDTVKVDYEAPDFLSRYLPKQPLQIIPLNDPEWSLDRFTYEFDDYSEEGVNYLIGRNPFLAGLWKQLGFKFWDGNIVMPFWWQGEVIYYQIRFTKKSKIRYFFPRISSPTGGAAKCPYIIPRSNTDNRWFIVCEGVYDAIACLIQAPAYTPMAVLGSSISDYQLEFLRTYIPQKILVYMDDTEKSIGVAKKIREVIDYCPIKIIHSDGTDPEENLIKRMRKGKSIEWIK